MTPNDVAARQAAARTRVLAVFGVFAVPLVLAIGLYVGGWRPKPTNYGHLVTPARPIRPVALTEIDHRDDIDFGQLYGKWLLVYFDAGSCEATCINALYKMRAAALFQGDNVRRVRRALIFLQTPARARLAVLTKQFPGMRIFTGTPAAVHGLAQQFTLAGAGALGVGKIDIVDPLGNWMMVYPEDAHARGMRKDLSRLLALSQIG